MDAAKTPSYKSVSEQLRRLIYYYGTPARAAKVTGLPCGYFYPVKSCNSLRKHVARHYQQSLDRAIAELDGIFEIKLSAESRAKAGTVARAQHKSVRELVESFLEEHFRA